MNKIKSCIVLKDRSASISRKTIERGIRDVNRVLWASVVPVRIRLKGIKRHPKWTQKKRHNLEFADHRLTAGLTGNADVVILAFGERNGRWVGMAQQPGRYAAILASDFRKALPHEVGHLLGASHGRGQCVAQASRTIMAPGCGEKYRARIFSSANRTKIIEVASGSRALRVPEIVACRP